MTLSAKATEIHTQITKPGSKMGDLRNIAKEIKKDHALAMELWSYKSLMPRLLAILIMDKKELGAETADNLLEDIQQHPFDERMHLADWLMANQLTKDKKTIAMIDSWKNDPKPLKRRIFWYYQARLRWTGQTPPNNSEELLADVEQHMANEEPEVQWAMNFTTAWIGIWDPAHRDRCVKIGEKLGLYKDEMVAKNCTPNYLPDFITIEVEKRK